MSPTRFLFRSLPLSILVFSACQTVGDTIHSSAGSESPPTQTASAVLRAESLPPPDDAFLKRSTLDVEALAAEVLRRHPTLDSLRGLWLAAGERPAQAYALEDPMLDYDLAPATIDQAGMDFGQNIAISQSFPSPGKRNARSDQAEAEAAAAFERIEDARRLLAGTARETFYSWYLVHRAIEINEANERLLTDTQKLAEEKYAAGKASKQDALQAEVERHHLEHAGITLERQRRVLQARINTLLHRATDASLPPPPARLPTPGPVADLARLQAGAVESRPDLKELDHRIEAARSAVALARLDYQPDFAVSAGYNSMWASDEHRPMVGVGLNLPLGKDRRAALREREAELAAAQSARAAAADKAALEVAEAREQLVESHHVVHLYREKFLPAAEAHLDAARADYAAGKTDILTLLTAEKNVRIARLGVQQALADYHTRRTALDAAAGAGF